MSDINNLYKFYQYILRKERGQFITPEQFTDNMDKGQLDCFEDWFKLYGQTQQIHDALRPFRKYQAFTSDIAGFVLFPDNYEHLLGQPATIFGSTVARVVFVNEDELPFALTSQLRPVDMYYPVAIDVGKDDVGNLKGGFSIYPQQTQVGWYYYLRRPATPVLSYTIVNRVFTYNQGASTQIEFSDVYINNILAKALFYAGVNMDEVGISQFAVAYDQETKANEQ